MTSLLPQFVHGGGAPVLQLASLCLIFEAMAVCWFLFYVVAVSKAAHLFARSRVRRGTRRRHGDGARGVRSSPGHRARLSSARGKNVAKRKTPFPGPFDRAFR